MRHFPVFLSIRGRRILVSGAGETAVAKLRLLLKTEASVIVYGTNPSQQITDWSRDGLLILVQHPIRLGDAICAAMLYCANDDAAEDKRAAEIGRQAGALVNIVDNLEDSQFITPAIVDRDPVTIAIGTEGAAPVLARKIKADIEASLPSSLGLLARVGQAFRKQAARLPAGRIRRDFWSKFYFETGPLAFSRNGREGAERALEALAQKFSNPANSEGHVALIGAGPGDPDLLTVKARTYLHEADVVIHDRLVSPQILELARREAFIIETGKRGFGTSWKQEDINAEMIRHAREGAKVARLKSGDPGVFGRLDEELDALDAAGISREIIPGITAASAAAAQLGQSLTRRGRNSAVRIVTGHDVMGYADQDWRDLAQPGAITAVYMGMKAARFVQGRLLMHGADATAPVTIVENVSRLDQKIVSSTIAGFTTDMEAAAITGPAVILIGLSPRAAMKNSHVHETVSELVSIENDQARNQDQPAKIGAV